MSKKRHAVPLCVGPQFKVEPSRYLCYPVLLLKNIHVRCVAATPLSARRRYGPPRNMPQPVSVCGREPTTLLALIELISAQTNFFDIVETSRVY